MIVRVRLKEILENRRMTQTQLSQICGLSSSQISNFARNTSNQINKDYLIKIATALGITDISELIEFQEIRSTTDS